MMLEQLPLHRLANCHNFRQVGETSTGGWKEKPHGEWLYIKKKGPVAKRWWFETSNSNF